MIIFMMHIDELTDDCLEHIFSYLPVTEKLNVARVCKRWQTVIETSWCYCHKLITSDSFLGLSYADWARILFNKTSSTKLLTLIIKKTGKFLNYIDLNSSEFLTKDVFKALINYCTNIVDLKLQIYNPEIENKDLSILFLNNRNLRLLQISHFNLSSKCLLNLPKNSIETVILLSSHDGNKDVSDNLIKFLPRFKNLSKFKMKSLYFENNQSLEAIGSCTNLKFLSLTYMIPYQIMSSNQVNYIAQLKNLQKLEFDSCYCVNDDLLIKIGSNLLLLKVVLLGSCKNITDVGVKAITKLPQLEILDVSLTNITDQALNYAPSLRKLCCTSCNGNFQSTGLCNLIRSAENLEYLDVSNSGKISQNLVNSAMEATKLRTNNILLNIYTKGTRIRAENIIYTSKLLYVNDFSQPILDEKFNKKVI